MERVGSGGLYGDGISIHLSPMLGHANAQSTRSHGDGLSVSLYVLHHSATLFLKVCMFLTRSTQILAHQEHRTLWKTSLQHLWPLMSPRGLHVSSFMVIRVPVNFWRLWLIIYPLSLTLSSFLCGFACSMFCPFCTNHQRVTPSLLHQINIISNLRWAPVLAWKRLSCLWPQNTMACQKWSKFKNW